LTINPLTVVAPGIVREIFGAFAEPGTANAEAPTYPDPQR
jgi:hypothetical protein